ncbi:hypothetical protein [Thermomonospora curvata]|uniref:hypothetical protein n=1 Tax=Thermomonospora curvata TaxID=2020 RepID=UPI0011D1E0D3|nr:hypothetical protein [Thermomonospora curvata]
MSLLAGLTPSSAVPDGSGRGTGETRRLAIAEWILGLPRERSPGRDVPFRELITRRAEGE